MQYATPQAQTPQQLPQGMQTPQQQQQAAMHQQQLQQMQMTGLDQQVNTAQLSDGDFDKGGGRYVAGLFGVAG
jgi:hypothetical protein